MELIDRYLQAVSFWLPKTQRQDIITELSEDLRSQIEDREVELGRELSEAEVEAVLQRRGNPLLVAERYLPQRYLIGPVWFPIYRLVLSTAMLVYVLPWLLVWVGFVLFVPSYRAEHSGFALVRTLGPLGIGAAWLILVVTLGFGFLERYQAKFGFFENWTVRKLPTISRPNRISRSTSIAELAGNLGVLLWWVGVLQAPAIPDLRVALAPGVAHSFYWPVLLLLTALTVMAGVNAVYPWWTRRKIGILLLVDGFGFVLTCLLFAVQLHTGIFAEIASAKTTAAALAPLGRWLNVSCAIALVVALISFVGRGVQNVRRLRGIEPLRMRLVS